MNALGIVLLKGLRRALFQYGAAGDRVRDRAAEVGASEEGTAAGRVASFWFRESGFVLWVSGFLLLVSCFVFGIADFGFPGWGFGIWGAPERQDPQP